MAPIVQKISYRAQAQTKITYNTITINARTLNTIYLLPELTAYAAEHSIDIIGIQEHRC